MFDKLIDILKNIWGDLIPFFITTDMQLSCMFRLGKFKKTFKAGLHCKIPFVDDVQTYHVKTRTVHLTSQTLTTKDGKQVVCKAIARFHIDDIKKYVMNIWSADDAMCDTIHGIVGDIVKNKTWDEVVVGIEQDVFDKTKTVVEFWGMCIEKVTFSDMAQIKSYRLIGDIK